MTPRAPSPIRAAAKTSGFSFSEQVSTEPSAVTSSRPRIWAAIEAESRPVPCVPVLVAPGDRLLHDVAHVRERQALAGESRFSRFSGVPASTVTVPRLAVDLPDAGQQLRADQHAVGGGGRGEGVAGADRLHLQTVLGGPAHGRGQLLDGGGGDRRGPDGR